MIRALSAFAILVAFSLSPALGQAQQRAVGAHMPTEPASIVVTISVPKQELTVVVDGVVVARPMLPLTLSFDHAVVDGAPAARFVETLRGLVETAAALDEKPAAPPDDRDQMSRKTSIVAPRALRRSARSS